MPMNKLEKSELDKCISQTTADVLRQLDGYQAANITSMPGIKITEAPKRKLASMAGKIDGVPLHNPGPLGFTLPGTGRSTVQERYDEQYKLELEEYQKSFDPSHGRFSTRNIG